MWRNKDSPSRLVKTSNKNSIKIAIQFIWRFTHLNSFLYVGKRRSHDFSLAGKTWPFPALIPCSYSAYRWWGISAVPLPCQSSCVKYPQPPQRVSSRRIFHLWRKLETGSKGCCWTTVGFPFGSYWCLHLACIPNTSECAMSGRLRPYSINDA